MAENYEDTLESIRAAFSIERIFKPWPWGVTRVIPLRNDIGELLAYVEPHNWNPIIRRDLPTEIFNHELKELNLDDYLAVSDFMSTYGLIGITTDKQSWHPDDSVSMILFSDVHTAESYADAPFDYIGYLLKLRDKDRLDHNTVHDYFIDLRNALKRLSIEEGRIVTPSDVEFAVNNLLSAARLAKAFMQTDDPQKLADLANGGNPDVFENFWSTCECLNKYLEGMSPQFGFVEIHKGVPSDPTFVLSRNTAGSFEQAAALQIWEFALKGCNDSYRVCSECGEIFVTRRSTATRTRKPSEKSKAFCCDKCKNRYRQREYRKTPGYKAKQMSKKE